MPTVFGPSPGPRQGPNGETFDLRNAPRTVASISFLTDESELRKLLPPNCELDGEPLVTVEHVTLRELEWLAGRGYSLLSVSYPVRYRGSSESVRGLFMSVLWENRCEPILTGREELGFSKLYCELPEPRHLRGARLHTAVWEGHEFIRMTFSDLAAGVPPSSPASDGILHHRYIPSLRRVGEAAVDEMVLSPQVSSAETRYTSFNSGTGKVEFIRSTWEDIPTMFHIVNALASLPVLSQRFSYIAELRGATDLSEQRVLS
ncbi:acetoacetate decarboxylase family protein [Variovorax ginsengisoli]|uniref:Acetoacetate decarboxylase family protein n=2 Tax=Variovorax ginsengisoli TaxID=363844 RepID=A0ABT8SGE5_9BURK|nr:acetoacetate decarboxylase family protein [Variovorax ginsengisoli]MDN8617386.1 acetoacetate decarboxylase family protein [Variovorax ginsengisoli]MDO1536556.1 acetoacetate decarboxylase family protein [Variovorax ginsengisoli]